MCKLIIEISSRLCVIFFSLAFCFVGVCHVCALLKPSLFVLKELSLGVSNSTGGPTHPVNPTGPEPTPSRPDYSGGRRRVFFSRIRSGRFSLGSSPQNSKKPKPTELYSIFRRDFSQIHEISTEFGDISSFMLRSSYNLMGFAQIRLRSVENMMRFAQIWRNSDGFYSNPAKLRWYLLKSGDDLVYFCLDLVIFAKIR